VVIEDYNRETNIAPICVRDKKSFVNSFGPTKMVFLLV
jgi:hypothetical protein